MIFPTDERLNVDFVAFPASVRDQLTSANNNADRFYIILEEVKGRLTLSIMQYGTTRDAILLNLR
jgi:hypothetical protein